MPIYEYRCESCNKELEAIQKFSDKPLKTCPECGGRLAKLISSTSFVLKGSGWYADGYSSPASEKANPVKAEKKTVPEKKPAPSSA
jgi:putative FmdB family regulatory protein